MGESVCQIKLCCFLSLLLDALASFQEFGRGGDPPYENKTENYAFDAFFLVCKDDSYNPVSRLR